MIPDEYKRHLHIVDEKVDYAVFKKFDMTICTRFHAQILSIIAKIPFVSISSTRKVDILRHDLSDDSANGFKFTVDPNTLRTIDLPETNKIAKQIEKQLYYTWLVAPHEEWYTNKSKIMLYN